MGQVKIKNELESAEDIKKVLLEISKVVNLSTGIQLGEKQFSMVENRLKSHMIKLGIPYFSDYLEYFKAHKIVETEKLTSLMTTHHTYFFREFNHFEYLETHLPEIIQRLRLQGEKKNFSMVGSLLQRTRGLFFVIISKYPLKANSTRF